MDKKTKRVPGTVRTGISDDAKGDPTRVYPHQPDIYVPEEQSDAITHSAGEHQPSPPEGEAETEDESEDEPQ